MSLHRVLWWILFTVVVDYSAAQTSPTITTTAVLTLFEDQTTDLTITTISCSDPDGDDVVVSGDISPQTGCVNCFIVVPINVGTGQYELNYYPSVANLDFNQVPEYTVTLTCDDGNDPVTTYDVEVRLIPNSYPYFDNGLTDSLTISNTRDILAGTDLHTVAATDPDGDPIYYTLKTTPASSNFAIGYTDGVIRAVNDLDSECVSDTTFEVTITDGKGTNIGPQVIDVDLDNANEAPVINNLPATDQFPEDTSVGTVLLNVDVTDDSSTPTLMYDTSPASARGLFTLSGTQLTLASDLDYENFAERRPLVLITASDGSCPSKTYTYTVSVTDVNEPPIIDPEDAVYEIYEGDINYDPNWQTIDPDLGDVVTYSIKSASPSTVPLTIDPDTGVIKSTIPYDVDQGAMTGTVTLTVQVTDQDGLTDETKVVLHIKDANDNPPVITTKDLYFTVTECTDPGFMLGSFDATDDDSDFQDNDVIEFSKSGGGTGVIVTPDGDVILNTRFAAGTSATYTVTATDHGQYPGPLTALVPGTVTVTSTECPTTTTTTTTTSTTTTTTTTTTTPAPTADGFSTDDNLWWIILSALGGTAFAGLTTWLCLTRAMPACSRGFGAGHWMRGCTGGGGGGKGGSRLCGGEICKRKKVVKKPKKPKIIEVTPKERGNKPLAGNYEEKFWRERYEDDLIAGQPDRNKTPEPANYDGIPRGEEYPGRSKPKALPAPGDENKVWNTNVDQDYGTVREVRPAHPDYQSHFENSPRMANSPGIANSPVTGNAPYGNPQFGNVNPAYNVDEIL